MSDKPVLNDKGVPANLQIAMAETLFTALNKQEATLTKVAQQLHDDVSQVLSAVGLQLDALRMDFRDAAPALDQRAVELQQMLERAIEQLREISNALNPSIVERAGLHFALDRLVSKIRRRFSGALRLHFDGATHVPTAVAKTFYKITECALEDAVARPGCSAIDIQVKQSQGEFVLELNDNGDSDDSVSAVPSFARLLMDYYAAKEQLALTSNKTPGKGNTIRVSCPASRAPVL